jgi:hypothetical protein
MPFEVKPSPALSAIEITLWGVLTIDELRSMAAAVIDLAVETRFRRALADCRDYLGGASLGEVFFLTQDVSNRPINERGIEAFIAPTDARTAAEVEFYVNTARAHGTRVQMFATRDAAIQWLGSYGAAVESYRQYPRSP